MKIYFDESGNTGCCVLTKNNILNFEKQPFFVIGAVIVQDELDAENLLKKYKDFKKIFKVYDEIKGTDLMTRAHNSELEYVLKNIFDDKHFKINVYDKRFYIATLLLSSLLGTKFKDNEKDLFYNLASSLSLQDDTFFVKYCNYIITPTKESFHDYLLFLSSFKYKNISQEQNGVKIFVDNILKDNSEEDFYDDFMTFGWYGGKSQTNVVNLTALGELIEFIKDNKLQNEDILFIHDKINQFEETLNNELKTCGISLQFKDSKGDELLQLADNITGVSYHAFKKMREHFQKKEEWFESSLWDMEFFSKLLSIINLNNIKFTIPIQDWTISLCTYEMFSNNFPKELRKNIFFNQKYIKAQEFILGSIVNNKQNTQDILNNLKK